MKIFVSGSLAFDKIMDFPGYFKDHILPDKIHTLNVSFTVEKIKENFGGTAGNISYNLALLGENPVIFSTVGRDFKDYSLWLKKHGVDVGKIKITDGEQTAFCNIITDQSDNQLTAFYMGAMGRAYKAGLSDIKSDPNDDLMAIISPGCIDDIIELAKLYKQQNIPYIFDPGQSIPALSKENLCESIKGSKAFISNDYELSLVLNKTGWNEDKILDNTEMIVTTFGDKGSIIKKKEVSYKIDPAKPKNTSDPTGAGDAYRAGLIKGLIKNWPLKTVGQFAGVIACYTVEKYGTQTHYFTMKDVRNRYKENFGEELPE